MSTNPQAVGLLGPHRWRLIWSCPVDGCVGGVEIWQSTYADAVELLRARIPEHYRGDHNAIPTWMVQAETHRATVELQRLVTFDRTVTEGSADLPVATDAAVRRDLAEREANQPHWSTQRGEHNTLAGLPALAAEIRGHLDATTLRGPADLRQIMCVAEEAGELVGAFRRHAGMARRSGTYADLMDEFADVVITTFVAAAYVGVDLTDAIRIKTEKIMTRGWQDWTEGSS